MANLLEMAVDLVSSHARTTKMTKEELTAEVVEIHRTLQMLESGSEVPLPTGEAPPVVEEEEEAPVISLRKAFGKDKVVCMICGKAMKTLARHIKTVHDMTPTEYRRKFDIASSQPLVARSYSESRREMAIERDLGANLAKAREAKAKGSPRRKRTASKK